MGDFISSVMLKCQMLYIKLNENSISLSLFRQMEFSIKLHTKKSGLSITYMEGSQVIIVKKILYYSLKINFVLANSDNPDEMVHKVAFYLGLHCLPKFPFRGFQSPKGCHNNWTC